MSTLNATFSIQGTTTGPIEKGSLFDGLSETEIAEQFVEYLKELLGVGEKDGVKVHANVAVHVTLVEGGVARD